MNTVTIVTLAFSGILINSVSGQQKLPIKQFLDPDTGVSECWWKDDYPNLQIEVDGVLEYRLGTEFDRCGCGVGCQIGYQCEGTKYFAHCLVDPTFQDAIVEECGWISGYTEGQLQGLEFDRCGCGYKCSSGLRCTGNNYFAHCRVPVNGQQPDNSGSDNTNTNDNNDDNNNSNDDNNNSNDDNTSNDIDDNNNSNDDSDNNDNANDNNDNANDNNDNANDNNDNANDSNDNANDNANDNNNNDNTSDNNDNTNIDDTTNAEADVLSNDDDGSSASSLASVALFTLSSLVLSILG
eukprot:Awhi_evm1s14383